MAIVYLETSFVSACVTDRVDIASAYRKQVSERWWDSRSPLFDLVTGQPTLEELGDPRFPRRAEAVALLARVPLLSVMPEVAGLAKLLVAERAMPGPPDAGDALHLALATAHRCDYVVTWNVRHLANVNKLRHLQIVCLRVGYAVPSIVTPDLLRGDPEDGPFERG